MADAQSSDYMEVEDSNDSAKTNHTDNNGVSEDEIKLTKSTSETEVEAIEEDSMNLDNIVADDSNPRDEDMAVNAPEVDSLNSKEDEPKSTNGTIADSSVQDQQKESEDVPGEDKNETMEVDEVVSSPVPEKQTSEDSPLPKAVTEILAEVPPKDSPETIVSSLSPFVKDRCDSVEPVNDKNEKEEESNHNTDIPETINIASTSKEADAEGESKEKSKKEGKKKKNKYCAECGRKKKLPLRLMFQGQMTQLCSETCFANFKEKRAVKVPTVSNENCGQCQEKIENGPGYFPAIGEVKILCSVECIGKYHEKCGKPKKCNQCKKMVESMYNRLSWETMTFCNEECLGKYQGHLGSHCACCQTPVQQTCLGKYSVCFGADIRQFCSGSCLEEFKKGLKVCTFCQADLATVEGFLAPVGEKGQFKDFCTQNCMERYETMNNFKGTIPESQECANCKKQGSFKIQAKHEEKTYALCCDTCVAGFRCSNQIVKNMCGTCHKFFAPSENENEIFAFIHEGTPRHFCTKACQTLFVLSHRKIIQCVQCKVKKYNFDMIEKIDANNHANMYCSLNCLKAYRVSQSSGVASRCAHCGKNTQPQYNLTMSDNSKRNFCQYDCVVAFQKDCLLASFPQPIRAASAIKPVNAKPTVSVSVGSSPLLANVVSLTQSRPATTPQRNVVPQTLVSVRPQGPALSVLSPKTQNATPQATPTSTLTISQTNQVKEFIVRPASPRHSRNKGVTVKPMMQTKGICVRQQTCHKAVQTDETHLPAILPVPFPVYFPSPVQMYTRTVTVPMPFPVPVPIPVPIFIKDKSSKTSEVQMLNVATKSAECLKVIEESNKNLCQRLGISSDTPSTSQGPKENAESIPEASVSKDPSTSQEEPMIIESTTVTENNTTVLEKTTEAPTSTTALENKTNAPENNSMLSENKTKPKEKNGKPKENNTVPTVVGTASTSTENNTVPLLEPKKEPIDEDNTVVTTKKPRKKKRSGEDLVMLEDVIDEKRLKTDDNFREEIALSSEEKKMYSWGIHAWRGWMTQKSSHKRGRGPSKKFTNNGQTDILLLSPAEISISLISFFQEARKEDGQLYSSGGMYFLLLGIQRYLNDNNRNDDIFNDEAYCTFVEHFHDYLLQYESRAILGDVPWSRIKEKSLWDTQQLGMQTPQTLLNTLIYFNTKFFKMKTNNSHFNLSFNNIKRHTDDTGSYLRFHAMEGADANDYARRALTQPEDKLFGMQCPVRFFEFYISKCPPHCVYNGSKYYLQVATSYSDAEYWFTDTPLSEKVINEQLCRMQYVEEAGIELNFCSGRAFKSSTVN